MAREDRAGLGGVKSDSDEQTERGITRHDRPVASSRPVGAHHPEEDIHENESSRKRPKDRIACTLQNQRVHNTETDHHADVEASIAETHQAGPQSNMAGVKMGDRYVAHDADLSALSDLQPTCMSLDSSSSRVNRTRTEYMRPFVEEVFTDAYINFRLRMLFGKYRDDSTGKITTADAKRAFARVGLDTMNHVQCERYYAQRGEWKAGGVVWT